jgi:catechol 2,3-dioxygenase-like lactoylglutathione lyase family enzyme
VARLDHITLPVKDWRASRDWWRDQLGFQVEFEIEDAGVAAVCDETDLTLIFEQGLVNPPPRAMCLAVQVADVEDKHAELAARGVAFEHPPQKVTHGYGAELLDPNGYRVFLWDEASMKAKGGG